MNIRRLAGILTTSVVSLLCASCADSENDVTIQGAGATFPAPLYKRWFLEYYQHHSEVRVNYQAIGSGAGVRQFNENLTDFGASDGFPSKDEMARAGHGMISLPMTAGSIAVCYNLDNVADGLNLSRDTYIAIFLGEIDNWNDPAIVRDNPGVQLPNLDITVVRRADGSGTTYAFTNHMNAIHSKWQKEQGGPGKGKSVVWPKGFLGGKGNAGVAALIQLTPGAIGYLEFGYAELADLKMARLQNKSGAFVHPSAESGMAAITGPNLKKIPDDLHIEITDPEGEAAYPIVTYTWMLCRQRYDKAKARTGAALIHVLEYCLSDEGQALAPKLGYLSMPSAVVERVRAKAKTIEIVP